MKDNANRKFSSITELFRYAFERLEGFINALNALAIRKRETDIGKRDKFLLRKINETVLPEPVMERYAFLQEKIRNKRFQYLLELSQLRNITMTELMDNLGLNIRNYA